MKISITAKSWEHDGSWQEVLMAEINDAVAELPEDASSIRLIFKAWAGPDGCGGGEVRDLTLSLCYDRDETDEEREARELIEQRDAEQLARSKAAYAARIEHQERAEYARLMAKYSGLHQFGGHE